MKIEFLFTFIVFIIFLLYLSYKINHKKSIIRLIDNSDIIYYKANASEDMDEEQDEDDASEYMVKDKIEDKTVEDIIEDVILENDFLEDYVLNRLNDEDIEDHYLVLEINNRMVENRNNEINRIVQNYNEEDEQRMVAIALKDNVHDSNIQRQTVKNYKNNILVNKSPAENPVEDKEIFIKQFAKDNIDDPEKLEKFNNILSGIVNRNAEIYNLDNKTETEILNETWDSINSDDKRNMFIQAILDSEEEERGLVCPTGTVTRIINHDLTNANIVPKDILRIEMLNTASKIMEECNEDETYTTRNDDEQKKYFKDKLIDKFKVDYKDVDFNTIEEEYKEWIDDI